MTNSRDPGPTSGQSRWVDLSAGRFHYRAWGGGRTDGISAVLLHSSAGSSASWSRVGAALAAARSHHWSTRRGDSGEFLVRAYHLARALLTRVGEHHLAWLVADRALTPAAQSPDPLLMASCAWHTGTALLFLGHFRECRDHTVAAARHLSAEAPTASADLALWGALHVLAAEAAAGAQDVPDCQALVAVAAEAARQLPADRETTGVWFGADLDRLVALAGIA
ncbi:hypothetical protein [Goodfellowiella coeruleoviolacea]|uniref:Uncharacterized protein n=1 Tax=Goodfellowiella coeruleoviolacea TaxID=334858 RepID=A0AAE3KIS6_9PSEU|nr:hypothetical protein [Goodfellowiella coeruleoviolacea]MCP2167704.1 hypothetical protein [Goodfellowiella coeruleoviolacea]